MATEDGIQLRLRVCTWNVGNAPPPSDLSEWLGTDSDEWDIIAVGAQEANFKDSEQLSTPSSERSAKDAAQRDGFEPNGYTPTGKLRKLTTRLRPPKKRSIGKGAQKAPPSDEMARNSSSDPGSARRRRRPTTTINTAGCSNVLDPESLAFSPMCEGQDLFRSPPQFEKTQGQLFPFPTPDKSNAKLSRLESRMALMDVSKLPSRESDVPLIDGAELQGDCASSDCSTSDHNYDSEDDEGEQDDGESSDTQLLFSPSTPGGNDVFLDKAWQNPFDELLRQERMAAAARLARAPDQAACMPTAGDDQSQSLSGTQDQYFEPSSGGSLPSSLQRTTAESPGNLTAKKFSKYVQRAIGSDYLLVAKHHLMEIKLLLFVNRKHEHRIGKTESTSEATGIGNVVGNKGAVAVKLVVNDTSFCFVSSHLAAHEGTKFCQQRNADVQEIMRNLEKSGMSKSSTLPSIHQFCHIIWMGDLNYRLDLERGLPKATMMTHEEKWDFVHDTIARKDIQKLGLYDELRGEIESMRAFANFSEGAITFLPTFKVTRGVPTYQYQRLRIPSYCDRILWHSLPMHKDSIHQLEYSAVESYCTSDHKPVFAVFIVDVPRSMPRAEGKRIRKSTLKCTIDFKSLRLSGLYEKKNGISLEDYDVLADGALSLRFDDRVFDLNAEDGGASKPSGPKKTPSGALQRPTTLDSPQYGGARPKKSRSGALQRPPALHPADIEGSVVEKTSHTRRGVYVEFLSNGLFAKEKVFRTEVPLKHGVVRECEYDELPAIPLIPMEELSDLMHKYVTMVFTRWGSKIASSCVLPIGVMLTELGVHSVKTKLELTKFGAPLAYVEVEAELCISMETWIDSRNRVIKVRRPKS